MRLSDSPFRFGDWGELSRNVLAAADNAFVDQQLARSGLTAAEAVADPDAWARLATIGKADLIADQERSEPYGTRRRVPESEIGLVVESSGSTGQGREVHYLSRADVDRSAKQWAAYLNRIGVGAEDVVALTFPIGMAGGGVRHWYAYVETGATVLRIGGLGSERKLEAIEGYGATTLVATPAYIDRLGAICAEHGRSPRELPVRRLMVATQSLSRDWIATTEESWGARLFEWYGTSAGAVAFCCEHGMLGGDGRRGTLHWSPRAGVQEVVDPATRMPVADGARGELVATPLINEAEAQFRVATGDEVCFVPGGSCACGSPWPGIESGTVRRLDTMFKVKGVNVWPAQVEAALLEGRDVLDYRVRIFQDEAKRERVRLELLAPEAAEALDEAVAGDLQAAIGIGFEVVVHDNRERWSHETAGETPKAKRWVDERPGSDGGSA